MTALDFPSSPSEGQTYSAANGVQYIYQSPAWMQVSAAQIKATALPRNRIVNGAFQISQENGNTALTTVATYPADQWFVGSSTSATITHQRVQVTTPNGSQNRLRITATTADATLAVSDILYPTQRVEGSRIADFRWGTAQARPVVVRFGFKGPAGTYSCALKNAANDRAYVYNFTISAAQANTDTEQVFAALGDTTGVWPVDNTHGLTFVVCLAAGTNFHADAANTWGLGPDYATAANTNGMATAGNVFELFDLGLYLDPDATGVAPKWEMPDEAEELRACQRYYYKANNPSALYGYASASAGVGYSVGLINFPATMRGTPSAAIVAAPTYTNCSAMTFVPTVDGCNAQVTVTATGSFRAYGGIYSMNARM